MKCKICNSKETDTLHKTHIVCFDCDTIFQKDLKVSISYDEDYVDQYNVYHTTRMMSLLRAGLVSGIAQPGPDRILDVGYGNGDFLRVMQMNGWVIFGTDIVNQRNHIPHITFEDACRRKWGVVTFFDSLEHFPDPLVARELCSDYIVVAVPNYPEDKDLRYWKHWKPGEHLFHFKEKGLRTIFNQYELVSKTSCEDIIRGKMNGEENIITYVFKRKSNEN